MKMKSVCMLSCLVMVLGACDKKKTETPTPDVAPKTTTPKTTPKTVVPKVEKNILDKKVEKNTDSRPGTEIGKGTTAEEKTDAKPSPTKKTGPTPANVLSAYLRTSGKSSAESKKWLDPKCHKKADMTSVASMKMMGVPIKITSLKTKMLSQKGDTMKMAAQVKGSASGGSKGTKTMMGKKVKFNIKGLNVGGISVKRTYNLAKVNGAWKVSCP